MLTGLDSYDLDIKYVYVGKQFVILLKREA